MSTDTTPPAAPIDIALAKRRRVLTAEYAAIKQEIKDVNSQLATTVEQCTQMLLVVLPKADAVYRKRRQLELSILTEANSLVPNITDSIRLLGREDVRTQLGRHKRPYESLLERPVSFGQHPLGRSYSSEEVEQLIEREREDKAELAEARQAVALHSTIVASLRAIRPNCDDVDAPLQWANDTLEWTATYTDKLLNENKL